MAAGTTPAHLGQIRLREKLAYIHNHCHGLQTFLTDGRVEIDSNKVKTWSGQSP
jgi:hypothetical protein